MKIAINNNTVNHLGVIMDGNGRWAHARNLTKFQGYQNGARATKRLIEACITHGIKHLSIYVFSSENWARPKEEVEEFMLLLESYIHSEAENLHKNGIKLLLVGEQSKLNHSIQKKLRDLVELTKDNDRLYLYIALSYGGRAEIVDACKKLISMGVDANEINEQNFKNFMYEPTIPDIDLLIRTGGDQRISNFMLWHIAYSELYFINKHWPDFTEIDLLDAISTFKAVKRNFGHSRQEV